MSWLPNLRAWASRLKRDSVTLWFAYRHPETPWAVRLLCFLVVAYALSPIDLIPDFIPVLGYLDDLLLLPGLIWLSTSLLPRHVIEVCRQDADAWLHQRQQKPRSYLGAVLIMAFWMVLGYGLWRLGVAELAAAS